MTASWREVRVARNHALFREVNERIYSLTEGFGAHTEDDGIELAMVCECGSAGCAGKVLIDTSAYSRIRAHSRRFIVLAGHEQTEPVVESAYRYVVVEQPEPVPVEV